MGNIATPWFAEVVLISWRAVRKSQRPPLPSELLASFIAFGAFSLIADSQPEIATLLGWGIVVATALNFFPNYKPTVQQAPSSLVGTGNPKQPYVPNLGGYDPVYPFSGPSQ